MTHSSKRNLVIVRAGPSSLHNQWLDLPYERRDFDIIVSYFDETAFSCHKAQAGVSAFFVKGGKWDGLYKTILNSGNLLETYDYFWLPDDDIACTGTDVNKIFRNMADQNIRVGQPSLTLDSYFTHFLLLHCPTFKLRYSNFIEVMVPCLRSDILREILPQFEDSMSGFGLDYVWCRLPGVGKYGAAIFDDIQVCHTRPIGKILLRSMDNAGRNPKDEERSLCELYNVKMDTTPIAYSGYTRTGQFIDGKLKMAWHMSLGYSSVLSVGTDMQLKFGPSKVTQLVRRQITRPCDLSSRSNTRGQMPKPHRVQIHSTISRS